MYGLSRRTALGPILRPPAPIKQEQGLAGHQPDHGLGDRGSRQERTYNDRPLVEAQRFYDLMNGVDVQAAGEDSTVTFDFQGYTDETRIDMYPQGRFYHDAMSTNGISVEGSSARMQVQMFGVDHFGSSQTMRGPEAIRRYELAIEIPAELQERFGCRLEDYYIREQRSGEEPPTYTRIIRPMYGADPRTDKHARAKVAALQMAIVTLLQSGRNPLEINALLTRFEDNNNEFLHESVEEEQPGDDATPAPEQIETRDPLAETIQARDLLVEVGDFDSRLLKTLKNVDLEIKTDWRGDDSVNISKLIDRLSFIGRQLQQGPRLEFSMNRQSPTEREQAWLTIGTFFVDAGAQLQQYLETHPAPAYSMGTWGEVEYDQWLSASRQEVAGTIAKLNEILVIPETEGTFEEKAAAAETAMATLQSKNLMYPEKLRKWREVFGIEGSDTTTIDIRRISLYEIDRAVKDVHSTISGFERNGVLFSSMSPASLTRWHKVYDCLQQAAQEIRAIENNFPEPSRSSYEQWGWEGAGDTQDDDSWRIAREQHIQPIIDRLRIVLNV